jgi:uncharacterized SAM-binding protein YcdF (DUF218 family)
MTVLLLMPPSNRTPRAILWGVLTHKERWGLSWRGWLGLLLIGAAVCWATALTVYPFLAVTQRVTTRSLVVEGWVHEYAIQVAVKEFTAGAYQRVFTTGGPVQGMSSYVNDYSTSAGIGAGRLRAAGLSANVVQMVPSKVTDRDRTYHAALALKNWLDEHDVKVTAINVLTEGAHARRTRLLFQKAFGDGVAVGVIAIHSPDYDPKHWWRFSEGVRDVVGEGIAYLYARFFFSIKES